MKYFVQSIFKIIFKKHLFIYLVHQVLAAACGAFSLPCSMWDI